MRTLGSQGVSPRWEAHPLDSSPLPTAPDSQPATPARRGSCSSRCSSSSELGRRELGMGSGGFSLTPHFLFPTLHSPFPTFHILFSIVCRYIHLLSNHN